MEPYCSIGTYELPFRWLFMKLRSTKGTGDGQIVAAGILTLLVVGVLFVHLSAASFVTEETSASTEANVSQGQQFTLHEKRPRQPGGG